MKADLQAAIDALRDRGAAQADAVRFRFIEAMARRAARHGGDARRLLDARLAAEVAACSQRLEADRCRALTASGTAPLAAAGGAGLLAGLVLEIGRRGMRASAEPADVVPSGVLRAGASGTAGASAGAGAGAGAPRELPALQFFRNTWSRLRVERQLTQSQAQVPENAGPLHSDRLVLRALQTMRDIAPAYLDRFMAYADTLMWLDQARGAQPVGPVSGARGEAGADERAGKAAHNAAHKAADKKRKPVRRKADKPAGPASRAD